jgi:hypothetical protein
MAPLPRRTPRYKVTVRPEMATSFLLLRARVLTHAKQGLSDRGRRRRRIQVVSTYDLDQFGIDEVIRPLRARIGNDPVYLRRVLLARRSPHR